MPRETPACRHFHAMAASAFGLSLPDCARTSRSAQLQNRSRCGPTSVARSPLPTARLRQLHGESRFTLGWYSMRSSWASLEIPPIRQPRERGKFRGPVRAGADDFIAELTSPARKLSSAPRRRETLFEQRVAGANGVHVTLEQRQITRLRLREQQSKNRRRAAPRPLTSCKSSVQKTPCAARRNSPRVFFTGRRQRQFAFARRQ